MQREPEPGPEPSPSPAGSVCSGSSASRPAQIAGGSPRPASPPRPLSPTAATQEAVSSLQRLQHSLSEWSDAQSQAPRPAMGAPAQGPGARSCANRPLARSPGDVTPLVGGCEPEDAELEHLRAVRQRVQELMSSQATSPQQEDELPDDLAKDKRHMWRLLEKLQQDMTQALL